MKKKELSNTQDKETPIAIADDLTGANELAALLSRNETFPRVIINPAKNDFLCLDSGKTIVLDLETRSLDASAAYKSIREVAKSRQVNQNLIYKKIDSTLRGNIIPEIKAAIDNLSIDALLFAPAFPEMSRRTLGGYHLVDDQPLTRTEYLHHEDSHIDQSSIYHFFNSELSENISALIELPVIEKGPGKVVKEIDKFLKKEVMVIVCDAVDKNDLKTITSAVRRTSYEVLPVGSAGLFQAISGAYKPNILDLETTRAPVLFVCGSLNKVARQQLKMLDENRTDLQLFKLQLETLIALARGKTCAIEKHIKEKFMADYSIAITTPSEFLELDNDQSSAVERGLGIMTKRLLRQRDISGLFVTGGETATKVLQTIGVKQLKTIGELEPLIPVSFDKNETKKIITKAGGFGSEEVMLKAIRALR